MYVGMWRFTTQMGRFRFSADSEWEALEELEQDSAA